MQLRSMDLHFMSASELQSGSGALEKLDNSAPYTEVIYRHRGPVRLTHWINVICVLFLLGSGLNIFNAHPRLYWGKYGADADHAFFSIDAISGESGPRGVTQIGSWHFDTTGILGWSKVNGEYQARGWPSWLTIPSFQDLADARHWHFLFAWLLVFNGLIYLGHGLYVRHLQTDIWPTLGDLKDIPRSVADHVRLRHPSGAAAKRYNVLQRLAYLGVIILISLMVLTGLSMSPGFNAIFPRLLDIVGGRQSARSIHFALASLIVLFVFIHVIEVMLAGPVNEIRSMLTGYYRLPSDRHCSGTGKGGNA